MTDVNDGLPPNDLRLFLRTISLATPEQVIKLGRESADHIDALEASNKALVEALEPFAAKVLTNTFDPVGLGRFGVSGRCSNDDYRKAYAVLASLS